MPNPSENNKNPEKQLLEKVERREKLYAEIVASAATGRFNLQPNYNELIGLKYPEYTQFKMQELETYIERINKKFSHNKEEALWVLMNVVGSSSFIEGLISHPRQAASLFKAIPEAKELIFSYLISSPNQMKMSWNPRYANTFWKHFPEPAQKMAADKLGEILKADDEKLIAEAKNAAYRADSARETIEKFTKPSFSGFLTPQKEKLRAAIYVKLLSSENLSPFSKNVLLYALMKNKSHLQAFVQKHRNADLGTLESFIMNTVLKSPTNIIGAEDIKNVEKQIKGITGHVDDCINRAMKNKNISEVCQPLVAELKSIEINAGYAQVMPQVRQEAGLK